MYLSEIFIFVLFCLNTNESATANREELLKRLREETKQKSTKNDKIHKDLIKSTKTNLLKMANDEKNKLLGNKKLLDPLEQAKSHDSLGPKNDITGNVDFMNPPAVKTETSSTEIWMVVLWVTVGIAGFVILLAIIYFTHKYFTQNK